MGRAKINDLSAFFTIKYGSMDSLPFQRARLNFVQSMAAYSVTCYILQARLFYVSKNLKLSFSRSKIAIMETS